MRIFTRCEGCPRVITLNKLPAQTRLVCDNCEPTSLMKQIEMQRRKVSDVLSKMTHSNDATDEDLDEDLDKVLKAECDKLYELSNVTRLSLAQSAIHYAAVGWPVFPLVRGGKLPVISKRSGGNGFKDATTDTDVVTSWWKKYPDANIGVVTGHKFDVIDVDFDKGGAVKWADIRDDDQLEVHATVMTPHGLHAYILPTGSGNTASSDGIDFRGIGGYVVVPPSNLTSESGITAEYRWWTKPSYELLEM